MRAQLFGEMWPLLQARIPESTRRQEFLGRLVALFLKWDVDPENLADVHPEIRQTLAALGVSVDEEQADDPAQAAPVALLALVGALRDSSLKVRRAAASAIESLVAQKFALPKKARLGLEEALSDKDELVRRRVASTLKRMGARGKL